MAGAAAEPARSRPAAAGQVRDLGLGHRWVAHQGAVEPTVEVGQLGRQLDGFDEEPFPIGEVRQDPVQVRRGERVVGVRDGQNLEHRGLLATRRRAARRSDT